jgi:hypothetical protein
MLKYLCYYYVWLCRYSTKKGKFNEDTHFADKTLFFHVSLYCLMYILVPLFILLLEVFSINIKNYIWVFGVLIFFIYLYLKYAKSKLKEKISKFCSEYRNIEYLEWFNSNYYSKGYRHFIFHQIFLLLSVPLILFIYFLIKTYL